VFPSAPSAGIRDVGGKFVLATPQLQSAIRGAQNVKLEGLPAQHHGNDVGPNLNGVGVNNMAVQGNSGHVTFSFEFHYALSLDSSTRELNFEFHGM
jgi:hypothetical protein